MNKKGKQFLIALFLIIILLSTLSFASAGFADWIRGKLTPTGKATTYTGINITVGAGNAPQIIQIGGVFLNHSISDVTLNEAGNVNVTVNFSVTDADGISNLRTIANVSFFRVGETQRINTTCGRYESSGNNANYSCRVDLWWFDQGGTWTINATISDVSGNRAENSTINVTIVTLTGFNLGPANITFATLNPGAANSTPTTNMRLNNTGNQDFASDSISVNATTLWGETTTTIGLYSGNFTISNTTSGGNIQCDLSRSTFNASATSSRMNVTSGASYVIINGANLSRGNSTINNGAAGQTNLYLCLTIVGSELSQQSYSTSLGKSWTIQAV